MHALCEYKYVHCFSAKSHAQVPRKPHSVSISGCDIKGQSLAGLEFLIALCLHSQPRL